jgi:hypothetical protein
MSPGGHLLTTALATAVSAELTGSWGISAGIAVGGFLIDVDHAVDYLVFERQRDFRPSAFLRYYVTGQMKRTVLVLHSYELFAGLLFVAWWTAWYPLCGYLMGGLLHLALDIVFNGELTPRSIVAFYSFGYRVAHRFSADALLGLSPSLPADRRFWRVFFEGATPVTGRMNEPTVMSD